MHLITSNGGLISEDPGFEIREELRCRPLCNSLRKAVPDYCTIRRIACGGCEECIELAREGRAVSKPIDISSMTETANSTWAMITLATFACFAVSAYVLNILLQYSRRKQYKQPPGCEREPVPMLELGEIAHKLRFDPDIQNVDEQSGVEPNLADPDVRKHQSGHRLIEIADLD